VQLPRVNSDEETSDDADTLYPDEMSEVTEDDLQEAENGARRSSERAVNVRLAASKRLLNYNDYLKLDQILSAQEPESKKFDVEIHDEMLFIIIHQTYELWFKQTLHEVDSILKCFQIKSDVLLPENDLAICSQRTERVIQILKVLVNQFDVLETMSPQGFGDFRDFLSSASGFQSKQFRLIENKLGLATDQRITHSGCPYFQHIPQVEQQQEVLEAEQAPSLLHYIQKWLELLLDESWSDSTSDFAQFMRDSIERAAAHDRHAISEYPFPIASHLPNSKRVPREKAVEEALAELEKKRLAHLRLFDPGAHHELLKQGSRRMSFKATMAVVFIQTFGTELTLQTPLVLINNLIAIDEQVSRWRQRHSTLVMRMIGSKSGTGGSNGHAYLNAVLAKSRIFLDLCHASHYLLPSHSMPALPAEVKRRLLRSKRPFATSEREFDRYSDCGGTDCPGHPELTRRETRSNSLH